MQAEGIPAARELRQLHRSLRDSGGRPAAAAANASLTALGAGMCSRAEFVCRRQNRPRVALGRRALWYTGSSIARAVRDSI